MYLHIGQDTVVPYDQVIGIFDLDSTTYSRDSRDFLNAAQKNGELTTVGSDIPKAFVLCGGDSQQVYITRLGTAALKVRSETFSIE